MREIKLIRPKRMEAAMNGLIVEIDGKKEGKLGNGGQLVLQTDDNAHELYLHGGLLAGKAFSVKQPIPADTHAYTFQVDMLSITNGYAPVLRPTNGETLKDTLRIISLMGAMLTDALLHPNLRSLVVKLPEAKFSLRLDAQEWHLILSCGPEHKPVLSRPYSQTKGGLLGAAINLINHADLHTPEGRDRMIDQIFSEYLIYLPGYTRTGVNELTYTG